MTTKVRAIGPDGKPITAVYEGHGIEAGEGYTSTTYKGQAQESGLVVAVKVAKLDKSDDLRRELDILERLRQTGRPGARFVPAWASLGQELERATAATCIVMEWIGGETMTRHMAELGNAYLRAGSGPSSNILQKELLATQSGQQYAQLLMTMRDAKIISRGDRKAADFRWQSQDDGRLVVLDWNRAEYVDPDALDPARYSPAYIENRRRDLAQGLHDDLRLFAKWWAEFLLGRAVSAVPARDDADPAWQALTLGLRVILARAAAAGQHDGYATCDDLAAALGLHLERLSATGDALLQRLQSGEWKQQADTHSDLRQLIDLAQRRQVPEDRLVTWRSQAEDQKAQADAKARQAIDTIVTDLLIQRRWRQVEEKIEQTLTAIGPLTEANAAARLALLRWRAVAKPGVAVLAEAPAQAGQWSEYAGQAVKAMWQEMDWPSAQNALTDAAHLVPQTKTALRPLQVEVGLRRGGLGATALEQWTSLRQLDAPYADALRLAWPALARQLAALDTAATRDGRRDRARDTLDEAAQRIKSRFQQDATSGALLRAADDQALRDRLRGDYRALLSEFYDQVALSAADIDQARREPALATVRPIDALVTALLRGRLDDAATLLESRATPASLDDALNAIRRGIVDQLIRLAPADDAAYGGPPRWPFELQQALAAAATLDRATGAQGTAIDGVLTRLKGLQEQQQALRRRVGADAGREWPVFVRHVVDAPDNPDVEAALEQAVAARLEVWSPVPPAEDLFAGEASERVLEGYRARTLLALRTATHLPARLEAFSRTLSEVAPRLREQKPDLDAVAEAIRNAGGYPARLTALAEAQRDVDQKLGLYQHHVKQANATYQSLAETLGALELRHQGMANLAKRIRAEAPAVQATLGPQPELGRLWLILCMKDLLRLDLPAAETSLAFANDLFGKSQSQQVAKSIAQMGATLNQLKQWQASVAGLWTRLQRLVDAIGRQNRAEADIELEAVKKQVPLWDSDFVLSELERRVALLPAPPVLDIKPTTSGLLQTELEALDRRATFGSTRTPPSRTRNERLDGLMGEWQAVVAKPAADRPYLSSLSDLINRSDAFVKDATVPSTDKRPLLQPIKAARQGMPEGNNVDMYLRALIKNIERLPS